MEEMGRQVGGGGGGRFLWLMIFGIKGGCFFFFKKKTNTLQVPISTLSFPHYSLS